MATIRPAQPDAAELARRIGLAQLCLGDPGRPAQRARELALLALVGATPTDLLDVMCRECSDRPKPGTYCAGCGMQSGDA